ncbi:MAG: TRAP transporter small permease [Spirochaetaceae bacterium]|nr:TRAP transporter small permease [Spirochaetaceae bacterium]
MRESRLGDRMVVVMEKAVEWAVSIIVGLMVVNIALGVFFRYVLSNSLPWTEELGRYLMVWAGFLGATLAMRDNEHVGLTAFSDRLPPRAKKIVETIVRMIVLAFLVTILFTSFRHLESLSIQRSSALELPMVVPYSSVTVGVLLMAIENVACIFRSFGTLAKDGEGRKVQ